MKILISRNSAFTLIEILMAIVLIGILASVGVSQYVDFSDEARTAASTKRIIAIRNAISGDPSLISAGIYTKPGYENQMGRLPANLAELVTQAAQADYNPFTKLGWRGPYLNSNVADWNLDSWGNAFVYDSGARTISSNGPDEIAANADDIIINF